MFCCVRVAVIEAAAVCCIEPENKIKLYMFLIYCLKFLDMIYKLFNIIRCGLLLCGNYDRKIRQNRKAYRKWKSFHESK